MRRVHFAFAAGRTKNIGLQILIEQLVRIQLRRVARQQDQFSCSGQWSLMMFTIVAACHPLSRPPHFGLPGRFGVRPSSPFSWYRAIHECTLVRDTPKTRAASALRRPRCMTARTVRRRRSSLPIRSKLRASCFVFIHVYTTHALDVFNYFVSE